MCDGYLVIPLLQLGPSRIAKGAGFLPTTYDLGVLFYPSTAASSALIRVRELSGVAAAAQSNFSSVDDCLFASVGGLIGKEFSPCLTTGFVLPFPVVCGLACLLALSGACLVWRRGDFLKLHAKAGSKAFWTLGLTSE